MTRKNRQESFVFYGEDNGGMLLNEKQNHLKLILESHTVNRHMISDKLLGD